MVNYNYKKVHKNIIITIKSVNMRNSVLKISFNF